MPRLKLRVMRTVVEAMLTVIQRWEDKHADHTDYRMRELNGGLWQASQSMKAIIEGDFQPMLRQARLKDLPHPGEVGNRYAAELLSNVPIPMRTAD
jgi:hypothetical protein